MLLRKVSPHLILVTSLSDYGGVHRDEMGGWSFEISTRGGHSEITEERREIIQDQTAWKEFWKSHAGPDSPVPFVDFEREQVVVIHLEIRDRPGCGMNVTKIENRQGKWVICLGELKQGPHCVVAIVLTEPHVWPLREGGTTQFRWTFSSLNIAGTRTVFNLTLANEV